MTDPDSPLEPNVPSGGENAPTVETVEADIQEVTAVVANASLEANDNDEDDSHFDEDDEDIDPMSMLPEEVKARVDKLVDLHDKRTEFMDQYLKDRAALEKKYQDLCQPLYEERATIVQGLVEEEGEKGDKTEEVGIPQFWVCAMGHMDVVAELISEQDVDCLEHLIDIKCTDDANGEGFTLEFHFEPNDYFHNTVLTKRYDVPNLLLADEPILKSVEGCDIQWKKGKSLTQRELKKKQRSKTNPGQIRTVVKKERSESFFHFFSPPQMPSSLNTMENMDEEEADQLEESLGVDYDVAQAFRSHIIPKAVLWYTGEALEAEMAEMLGADGFPGDDGDFGGEGGEGGSPFPAPKPGEEPPECKQN